MYVKNPLDSLTDTVTLGVVITVVLYYVAQGVLHGTGW